MSQAYAWARGRLLVLHELNVALAARMLAPTLVCKLYHSVMRIGGLCPFVVGVLVSVISKLVAFWQFVMLTNTLEALFVATLYS